ncbi:WD domain, G-beta repeat-containing protein [Acanthamoeba castellanii str. Neff]|uniref:WD domain, G-beta repeat-containing protein n=1 Tax=Acanthamoeba castellanii (strain ATCC 30010 / Neff) TaxID=1257118 RepID=L8HCN1_ACACF|nr:WD domain, G-beta repeat-containing protein [Acanthamoeba castellanii str. Neff]ELR23304.1 WD domain, G-beta repeat-containing protein [Acanthamoeba castellanii str. Neff]
MEETVEEALKLWGELFQSSETAEPVKAKSSSGIVMPTELRVYRDDDAVTSVAICTERKLLFTASPTQAVRAWSLLSGERVGEYVGHTDWVYGVIVHGGELYSCSRDQTIRSWNIETFECTQVFETATNNLNTKKFFVAGGVLFVTCDDFALRLYNTRTGKVIRVLEGHTRPIRCMVLFKSQRELFTASGDGTIRRWNFKKGLELAVYKCHTEGVTSITIDEQRRLLYSAGQDGVVCVWDLSEAGDRANKQLSETDGELMQYKRRIDNIIQRNAGALVADDKLIKVTDEVLRLIQQGDDDQGAVVKEENEAPTTSSVVPPSPAGLPPLSPRLAHAAVHDGQAKAAKSSSANAAKGTLLKSGLLKLARGDSWRTKPGSNRTRDEVKHHRDDDGMRKLHTADAIMENAQKTRTKGDGAERVVLVDPLEDKRKKKEKEKEKKSNNEEPGKAATGGMKVKDQLFRLGATFSFDRKRREKKEAQQQQLEVKRSISEGDMPAVPATHKDRIQWLPEDKYSSNQSLIIKPAGQLEARNVRNVDAGSSGGGAGSAEMTATAEKKEHSREFDILGWMEEQIAIQDESEERREERAKSNSDERMNQPQADEQKSLAAEAEQYRDSRQEPGDSAREGPSVPAVEEGIENIALVVMQPFADISYIEFGTVLFKVISLCMRLCDADRRPTTKREQEPEASAVDEDDDEAKRVRNDLRLSVKEFTRNGMTLLQHIKRKALAKEALAVGLVGLEEDADDVDSREDEGSDRKAFLTAARIMLAAVKQLAEWLHGLGDSKPGRASQRTKSESGSDDAPPAADVDEQQTQTLFANLERQCGPETQHLLAEVRKPLGESTPASSAAARDILALGLPVFTELVGTLKRAADGDAVQSAQWAALADRHLLVLIQAARAVACADNGGSADLEAVQQRRQRLLVLECAVVVKASEAFRCRDDTMTEAAQALLRQKCGQLLAAVVQLLTTIRHECPAPKRNVD